MCSQSRERAMPICRSGEEMFADLFQFLFFGDADWLHCASASNQSLREIEFERGAP